ncbi:hypothetical protein JCM3774_002401 [Rhodotorula dairenensis]
MTVQPQYLPTPVPTPPPRGLVDSGASLINKKKQPTPPYLPNRHDYKPTHPDLFKIEFGPEGEEFGSCLRAQKAFKRGDTLCPIRNTLPGIKAYSSVQVLPDPPLASAPSSPDERRHIELNSDLLYVNHSCDPNVVFDVNGQEAQPAQEDATGKWEGRWRVRAERDIAVGEILTFAYFSTEWDMDQPFSCLCGTERCIRTIKGAKDIDQSVLATYFVNDHIKAMKEEQSKSTQ